MTDLVPSGLGAAILYAGVPLVALVIIGIVMARLYKRASKEIAFVRTGFGGEKVVMNGGALVLPVLHETMPVNMNTVRLAVERRNGDALITLDRLRTYVRSEFHFLACTHRDLLAPAPPSLLPSYPHSPSTHVMTIAGTGGMGLRGRCARGGAARRQAVRAYGRQSRSDRNCDTSPT